MSEQMWLVGAMWDEITPVADRMQISTVARVSRNASTGYRELRIQWPSNVRPQAVRALVRAHEEGLMVLLPELPDQQAGDGEGMEGAPSAEQDDGGGGWDSEDSEDSEDAGDSEDDEDDDPELMDEESLRQVIREELQAAQNRLQRRLLLCIAVVALLRLLW